METPGAPPLLLLVDDEREILVALTDLLEDRYRILSTTSPVEGLEIIAANPAQVEKAKANPKLAGWFVGQVMKATGGKANPAAVNQIVTAKLGL